MADEPSTRDGLFIRFGKFEAGAHGRLGVVVLAVGVVALLVGRMIGTW